MAATKRSRKRRVEPEKDGTPFLIAASLFAGRENVVAVTRDPAYLIGADRLHVHVGRGLTTDAAIELLRQVAARLTRDGLTPDRPLEPPAAQLTLEAAA